ncbi:MAG: TM0106 family RecB-like putative nuclease [Cyanobacteriota bacterium]|nr:TM0106 family RecB-like putative nuclease [Cyanobacteriota bacterium]
MTDRLITPSQLALFSRSPVIGAWWEELHAIDSKRAPRPKVKALEELLFEAGLEHEQVLICQLKRDDKRVVELRGRQDSMDYEACLDAMRSGVDYIWQASMCNGEMRGSADLLERIEEPSALGNWSYIPIECKLSSHSKPIYLVQACAYCELLTSILGKRPERFKLYLGGQRFLDYASGEFWSWYEQLRQRYRNFRAAFDPSQAPEDAPGDHGPWEAFIQQRLEERRDLILVAGMRESQRDKLRRAGISSIDDLASCPEDQRVSGLDPGTFARLRDQARVQLASESRDEKRPAFEVRPQAQQAKGLAMLPTPDAGDIWFDMEGFPDPVTGEKLEYLFGACYRDETGQLQFADWWAHSPEEEKQAFDDFVQWVQNRRERHPDLHVYHYASYEKTALGNLASRHQIHQAEMDQWFRDELLVDLYPIVRNGLLIGAPSYSIKKVERLYGSARSEEVENAADSVVQYAEWKKNSDPKILKDLRDYNEKDCQVTEGLHVFLLNLPQTQELPCRANKWGTSSKAAEKDKKASEEVKKLEAAACQLREELPLPLSDAEKCGPRGISWRIQKLISQLIDFHEREGKVEWWEFFNRLQMTPEEREDDSEVIALARLEGVEPIMRSLGYRYRFPAEQPLKLSPKDGRQPRFAVVPLIPSGERLVPLPHLVLANGYAWVTEGLLDEVNADQITLKVTQDALANAVGLESSGLPSQADLVPFPKAIYTFMLKHLVRLAQGWVFERKSLPRALLHLLQRQPVPELVQVNAAIRREPDATAELIERFLQKADGICLSLQGPPGTGKSTVTGELIAQLVEAGQHVAVSSNTNEAINNLLLKVQDRLDARSSSSLVVKVVSSYSEKADVKALAGSRAQALQEKNLSSIPAVLGGTIFTFVKEAYDETPFDLLVIDEAGQVSLSNLLYMSRIARNILLVGDQQQLSQPNRAAHPEDSGLSCLDYVMAKEPVVPSDRGVFLATSWRMPPALTQVVSNLFYEGKLQAAAANSANQVDWSGQGQGLLFESVHHSGNSTDSEEEVERIAALVNQLYGQPYERAKLVNGEMTTVRGELGQHDILITAPYNMQVNRLQKRIGNKARIGTVDKFQGQEAPVAIHSLTASDGDSAPRGLDFLLDPNRLNVAISRAQCLSIVVGSPQLATGISNSIGNVQRLNRLCSLITAQFPADGQEVGA